MLETMFKRGLQPMFFTRFEENIFFAHFKENTVPPTRAAHEDCELSFSVTDLSKTFKRVNPRKAAGPDGIASRVSEHVQISLLECLQTYSISPYPSMLSHLASRYQPTFLSQKSEGY